MNAPWFRRTEPLPTIAELTARAQAARAEVKAMLATVDRPITIGDPS